MPAHAELTSALPKGVSVIIPTINRAEVLVDTVNDMLAQDYDDYEIIIVDQSEEINEKVMTIARRSSPPLIRYFHRTSFKGLPQARNFGWRHASKDVLLYIDDDIRTGSSLVRLHYEAHASTGATMVAGGIDEAKGDHPSAAPPGSFNWWTATAVRNFSVRQPGWCLHAPGGNFSIRRQTLADIGGLDEALSVGAALYEESELALRHRHAGHKTWFEPLARLTHLAAPMGGCRVPKDWPHYMFGLAHNRAILIFRHLRWWHRPTALLRLVMLGISYSRVDGSLRPLWQTFRGLNAGRKAAGQPPLNGTLRATECTSF